VSTAKELTTALYTQIVAVDCARHDPLLEDFNRIGAASPFNQAVHNDLVCIDFALQMPCITHYQVFLNTKFTFNLAINLNIAS